jgi:hypothetical protein
VVAWVAVRIPPVAVLAVVLILPVVLVAAPIPPVAVLVAVLISPVAVLGVVGPH